MAVTDLAHLKVEWNRYPGSANIVTRLIKYTYWRMLDAWLRLSGRGRYLLMVCPARSGSSVTLHVLRSNPAVRAMGESHVSYCDTSDLRMLALRTNWLLRSVGVRGVFFLDKLVFGYHTISPEVLKNPSVRLIFLLREPLENLSSIQRAWPDSSPATVDDYYVERLDDMVALAEALDDPSRSFFLTYEELTGPTADECLASLQQWLGVTEPFSTDYDLIPGHGYGKRGRGDFSDNLTAGRVLAADERTSRGGATLDSTNCGRSVEAHRRTTDQLVALTTTHSRLSGTAIQDS